MTEVLRVANCSGFYGDRLSAMREMLTGGPVDVVTGDYLAELTMLILGRDQLKDPSLGYARTFLRQASDCLALAKQRGVRIVSNAGGLNPAGLAEALRKVAADQGLDVVVAHVDGDNLMGRDDLDLPDGTLTANAYLGAFGIAEALSAGADVVVTGRVTDASVVVGPAIWRFGWGRDDLDQLAGAVVAGHVIECGCQATGGNFSGFRDLLDAGRAGVPLGFPLAEIAADGSCVVTKHPDTGGVVTTDTVTAQLVYEIQSSRYLGPDVTVLLDTLALEQEGEDRVRISGVRGEAPPDTLKVCLNQLGGFRNQMELVLTGLDVEEKAAWVQAQVEASLRVRPAEMDWSLARTDRPDAPSEETASARLRCVVRDPSSDVVGKGFTAPLIELALASYPGFTATTPPSPATPYGVYRAAYVPQSAVTHTVHLPSGPVVVPPPVVTLPATPEGFPTTATSAGLAPTSTIVRVPLGTFVHARSGDKGGDANLGLWVSAADPRGADRAAWLLATVTPDWVRTLLPEAAGLRVDVVPLPNLQAVNVVIHDLLGLGVAASSRFDPQAKGLGEWARSRHVDIPEELL